MLVWFNAQHYEENIKIKCSCCFVMLNDYVSILGINQWGGMQCELSNSFPICKTMFSNHWLTDLWPCVPFLKIFRFSSPRCIMSSLQLLGKAPARSGYLHWVGRRCKALLISTTTPLPLNHKFNSMVSRFKQNHKFSAFSDTPPVCWHRNKNDMVCKSGWGG